MFQRPRILVDNPSDGGFLYWLGKLYLFALLGLVLFFTHILLLIFLLFARTVPPLPDLRTYADLAPGITSIYAGDGTLLAELANERREVVPLSRVPKHLID